MCHGKFRIYRFLCLRGVFFRPGRHTKTPRREGVTLKISICCHGRHMGRRSSSTGAKCFCGLYLAIPTHQPGPVPAWVLELAGGGVGQKTGSARSRKVPFCALRSCPSGLSSRGQVVCCNKGQAAQECRRGLGLPHHSPWGPYSSPVGYLRGKFAVLPAHIP